MAGSVRRGTARGETAADTAGLAPGTEGTLAAGLPVHKRRVPEMPPFILYGHHAHGQGHPGRDCAGNVPQLKPSPALAGADEGTCHGHVRRHPAE